MPGFSTAIRRLAAHFGFTLNRTTPHTAPSLPTYLRTRQTPAGPALHAICFDNDAWVQAQLFQALPTNRVRFSSPTLTPTDIDRTPIASPPAGRFITVADIGRFTPAALLTNFPWLATTEEWLLRAQLGAFWTGELDLISVAAALRPLELQLANILAADGGSLLQAPSTNVVLVFRPGPTGTDESARFRVNEALAFLSAPIVRRHDFRLLAGRGSFSFGAGVFNPGAVNVEGKTYLLPRAEELAWADQKADVTSYFSAVTPLLLTLDSENRLTSARAVGVEHAPDSATHRLEDFRLFRFRQNTFVNCSVITSPEEHPEKNHPVRPERLRARVALVQLEVATPRLTWLGLPTVDLALAETEKNWGFFGDDDRLFLLYSFAPYRLLRARNWPVLDFVTEISEEISLPIDGDGLTLRNSINPVDYDTRHWLHIVHKVYPGKQYSFWAVLLNKETLRPVRLSARPLARSWHSAAASIIYCCAALVDAEAVRLFAGWDDSSTALAVIPRARLDSEWTDLHAPPAP